METSEHPPPRIRRDGLCVVCRKPRKVPSPLQRGVPVSAYTEDPFCSAVCARNYYGTQLNTSSISK